MNALRAFEAAARHLSFTKAAEELFVTQAAVSHQIKALEEHLGIPLFRRLNRRLLLTEAGQAYLPPLREAFDSMEQATRRLHRAEDSGSLRVTAITSFATKWLLPRLARFRQRHPQIDVLVSASDGLVDLTREDFDMGLRFGAGTYPGLRVDHLMDDAIFPVCSPQLLESGPPLAVPGDLKHHTLLHDDMARSDGSTNDWRTWLKAAGVDDVNPDRGPAYSHSSLVLQAAIDGQGVALGRISLAADDMAAGRLVCPFGPVVKAPLAYYIASPPAAAETLKVRLFRAWLLEEAAAADESRPALPSF